MIFSMGFDDALVQRALVEAGGNEQAAIEMLIGGLHPDATAPPKKFNSRKTPNTGIFSMGFDERLVRDALVSVGGDEQQALEMLLCERASLSSSGALFAGGASASNPLAAAASKPPKQTKKKGQSLRLGLRALYLLIAPSSCACVVPSGSYMKPCSPTLAKC